MAIELAIEQQPSPRQQHAIHLLISNMISNLYYLRSNIFPIRSNTISAAILIYIYIYIHVCPLPHPLFCIHTQLLSLKCQVSSRVQLHVSDAKKNELISLQKGVTTSVSESDLPAITKFGKHSSPLEAVPAPAPARPTSDEILGAESWLSRS